MPTHSFTSLQMRNMEKKLAEHPAVVQLAKQDAVERSKGQHVAEELEVDAGQDPAVELEQNGQGVLELRWSGYFRSSDPDKGRAFAHILIEDEQLRELVSEDWFVQEDEDSEPDDLQREE